MIKSSRLIEHAGTVVNISEEKIFVKIESLSACSQCHSKAACVVSGHAEKIIEVERSCEAYRVGDPVTVLLEEKKGVFALALGYLFPFGVLLFVLGTVLLITNNELLSGLLAMGSLALYYGALWTQREKINSKFNFILKKIE